MKIPIIRTLVCLSILTCLSHMILLDVVYNTTQWLINDSFERKYNNIGFISQYSKATHRQTDIQKNQSVNFCVTELIGNRKRKTIFKSKFDSASSDLYDNKSVLPMPPNHNVNLLRILNRKAKLAGSCIIGLYEYMYKTTIKKSHKLLLNKQEIEIESNGRILNCSFDYTTLTTSYLVVNKYFVIGEIRDRLKVNEDNLTGIFNHILASEILLAVSFKQVTPNGEEILDFFKNFEAPNKSIRLKNVNTGKFFMSSVNVRSITKIHINNVKILISKRKEVSSRSNPHFLIYSSWRKPTNILPFYSHIDKNKLYKRLIFSLIILSVYLSISFIIMAALHYSYNLNSKQISSTIEKKTKFPLRRSKKSNDNTTLRSHHQGKKNKMRDVLFRKRVVELEKKVLDGSYSEQHTPDGNLSEKLFYINYYTKKSLSNTIHDTKKCDCFDRYKTLVGRYVLIGGALLQETITLSASGDGSERNLPTIDNFEYVGKRNSNDGKREKNLAMYKSMLSREDEISFYYKKVKKVSKLIRKRNEIEDRINKSNQNTQLNKYIQFENNLPKQNFTLISFEMFPELKRYNEYNQQGDWMGHVGTFVYPTFDEIKEGGKEIVEEWKNKSLSYYSKEERYITDHRGIVKVNEKGGYSIYNLNNNESTPTSVQVTEVTNWFNKKYFQLFGYIFKDMEDHRINKPHYFAAEVMALWDCISGHLFFQRSELGEFISFIYNTKKDYATEIRSWKHSDCMVKRREISK